MEEFDLRFADQLHLAQSMTDGSADERYFLWVPDWTEDAEEKDYLVLLNTGTRLEKKFKIVYRFKTEFISKGCCFAISKDGRTALAGYAAKKGVFCYDCESGTVLWNNPKIKRIAEVRFNNFDENIVEVRNNKLEITYLDKHTGQVLEPERAKNVRQVITLMQVSKNGKFLLTADTFPLKEQANYTVYNTETKEVTGRFVAQCQRNPNPFDVTDDGRFAVCSAYQRQGVSLIDVSTGEVLWSKMNYKKVYRASFDADDQRVIVGCDYDGIYFLDIYSGETVERISGEEFFPNPYGADVLCLGGKLARIGDHRISSSGFSWKKAVGTRNGVLMLLPGNRKSAFYDYGGNLLWESDELGGEAAYLENEDLLCAFWVEYYKGNVTDETVFEGKIVLASPKDGRIIAEADISDDACAFIHHNKTIVCSTGKMFDVSGGVIREIEESFAFVVGEKPE